MRAGVFLLAAAGLITLAAGRSNAQAYPITVVQFAGGQDQVVEFKFTKAVAYGADDKPLFNGTRMFILGFTGNTAGRVFSWDLARDKVRVSPAGKPAVWLACADLQAMPLACSTSLRMGSDGSLIVSGSGGGVHNRGTPPPGSGRVDLGQLPDCPGDPRCP